MPVHHERADRKSKQQADESRNPSLHRTKQREVSVERRPIITQDKPPTKPINRSSRTGTKPDDAQKAGSSSVRKATKPTVKESKITEKAKSIDAKKKAASTKDGSSKHTAIFSSQSSKKQSPRNPQVSKISSTKTGKPTNLAESSNPKLVRSKVDRPKEKNDPVEKGHVRTKTRTLSPSEVQVLKGRASGSKDTDRAKMEQLIQKPETTKVVESGKGNEESSSEEEIDYEDDFEDYESDFEDDTDAEDDSHNDDHGEKEANEEVAVAVEEMIAMPTSAARRRVVLTSAEERERERKLDSGSYHISAAPHRREIEEIKTAMQNENRPQRKQLTEEEADEGYLEEEKKSPSKIFDFSRAQRQSIQLESQVKLKKRGEVLSQMITLDTVTYSLLELPAMPYEVFINTYGNSTSCQVHCQTNEDDCEEEIQTEEIDVDTRWTQMPPTYDKLLVQRTPLLTREERLGVGRIRNDGESEGNEPGFSQTDTAGYSKFIMNASQVMLSFLQASQKLDKGQLTKSEIPCCNTMISLKDKKVGDFPITFIATGKNLALTVQQSDEDITTVISIWSLIDMTISYSLICRNEVTTACFEQRETLVFAGATDGSVNAWDLRESATMHGDVPQRSPTYTTAQTFGKLGHKSPVVAVIVLRNNEEGDENDAFAPIQVCSLAKDGEIIVWTVVQIQQSPMLVQNDDLGIAPWGRIRLVNTSSFNISNLTKTTDTANVVSYRTMAYGGSGSELLVADNSGRVIYCSVDGSLLRHKFFKPSTSTRVTVVTALAVYPYDKRYFLAGCSDGTIRLHSKEKESPLISLHWNLQDTSSNLSVKNIFWMPNKPCMFLALDSSSRTHVWNLAESDIYPQFSLPPSKQPFLSAAFIRNRFNSGSIILGRSNGELEVHDVLTEKAKEKEVWKKEAKMFQKYVKIL